MKITSPMNNEPTPAAEEKTEIPDVVLLASGIAFIVFILLAISVTE